MGLAALVLAGLMATTPLACIYLIFANAKFYQNNYSELILTNSRFDTGKANAGRVFFRRMNGMGNVRESRYASHFLLRSRGPKWPHCYQLPQFLELLLNSPLFCPETVSNPGFFGVCLDIRSWPSRRRMSFTPARLPEHRNHFDAPFFPY